MKRFLRINWLLLLSMIGLVAIGVVFIHSAGSARQTAALHVAWRSHALTAAFGLALYFCIAAIDYRKILDWAAWPCFAAAMVMLVAVLLLGDKVYGGRRWLWFFQPSEIAKLATIMLVAHLYGGKGAKTDFKGFLVALGILLVPAALILAEPDLGTALVLVPAVIVMLCAARVWTKGLVTILLVGLIAAGAVLGAVAAAERIPDRARREAIFAKIPLRPHQIKRLRVFLDPELDPNGSGWNLRQAKLSIGSGSIYGKGLGKGDQKLLGYLPPSVSMNDFIFAVVAEEAGFRGSAATLALFLALLLATVRIGAVCGDDRGRLLAAGVGTLVFCHVYVNVAMSIGLMPITGLPLPFISAGKTFLVVLMAAFGLVQSIAMHPAADSGDEAETEK